MLPEIKNFLDAFQVIQKVQCFFKVSIVTTENTQRANSVAIYVDPLTVYWGFL